jgi:hypothetical protein
MFQIAFETILRETEPLIFYFGPIRVAAPSKAWVCRRLPPGIAGSNPTGIMDVCLVVNNIPATFFISVRTCYFCGQKISTRPDDCAALLKFFFIFRNKNI